MNKIAKYAAPITALAAVIHGVHTIAHAAGFYSNDTGAAFHVPVVTNLATFALIIGAAIALYYLRKRHIYVLKEVQRLTEIAKAAQTAADAAQAALKEIRDAGKELTT